MTSCIGSAIVVSLHWPQYSGLQSLAYMNQEERNEAMRNADVAIASMLASLRTLEITRRMIVYERDCPPDQLQLRIASAHDPISTNLMIGIEAINALMPQGMSKIQCYTISQEELDAASIKLPRISGATAKELLGGHPR